MGDRTHANVACTWLGCFSVTSTAEEPRTPESKTCISIKKERVVMHFPPVTGSEPRGVQAICYLLGSFLLHELQLSDGCRCIV